VPAALCGARVPDALDIYSGNNQGQPLDVSAAKTAGIGLVIPKVSEGTYQHDPCFAPVWRECLALGVRRGGYHFVRPSQSTARAEAEWCWRAIEAAGGVQGDDILACDFENYPGEPWPLAAGAQSLDWLLAWLARIQELSGLPDERTWFYCNWSFLVDLLGKHPALRRYPLWYTNPLPNWPPDWPPALHQYGYADVPGGTAVCDADNFGPDYPRTQTTPAPARTILEDDEMIVAIPDPTKRCTFRGVASRFYAVSGGVIVHVCFDEPNPSGLPTELAGDALTLPISDGDLTVLRNRTSQTSGVPLDQIP